MVPRVHVKLKFRKDDYLPSKLWFKDENSRVTFKGQLNIKRASLKFENIEDERNNVEKMACKVLNVILGRDVRNAVRNSNEKKLSLVKKGREMHKKYLSDKFYENKRNLRKVERGLKYKLTRYQVKTMDEKPEDLEDEAWWQNIKYYWKNWERIVNMDSPTYLLPTTLCSTKLSEANTATHASPPSQPIQSSTLVPFRDRNEERNKQRWTEHFEIIANCDKVMGNVWDRTEKVCRTLEVNEDLFWRKIRDITERG